MNEMRIYVASLSDYNNGRLEGKWLDLSDYSDASELMEAIQEMLDDLTKKYNDGEVREEWAVHDYEGIPSTLASEYMGEQDFQQLYDIAEVADERGIPVEVLVERAGDTGSDDYEALADSLIMSVNGNDESDIVYEYENQIGELGFDWWSNHVGITITDQRLLYGEDVDNFKEEILAENPDMDESEAEGQAEEMADAEEEARNSDLIEYLNERGYYDEFPNWVYKDYEKAWKSDLSYEFDVIHHDGRMYVFTNNYGLGGTILSGMIGAYIGYKVGRAKPQKKGFETEKRIGRKIKGAFSKKKMARGGGVSYRSRDIDKIKVGDIVQYAHSNSEYEAEVIDIVYDSRFKELSSVTIKWLDNGKIEESYLKDLMLSKDKKMAKGGSVEKLADLMSYTDYLVQGWDDPRKKSLEKSFFGKNIDVKVNLITGGDFKLAMAEEISKIKMLSEKVDFDEVRGEIDYGKGEDNTNLQFYKNGQLVMTLKGDYNSENESLDTIIELNGETTELNYHPADGFGGVSLSTLNKNIYDAFSELGIYSAVVSIDGYEEYAEDVEGLENAKELIQNIKGNTKFQVLKGRSVGIGKRVDDSRVVEEYAKGGSTYQGGGLWK
jgi:antirestriction protein